MLIAPLASNVPAIECPAPDGLDAGPRLGIRARLHHTQAAFQRLVVQHATIAYIGLLEPQRRGFIEHAHPGESLELANIVAERHDLRMRARGPQYPVLHQEFDVGDARSEEHTSELQSPCNIVCR